MIHPALRSTMVKPTFLLDLCTKTLRAGVGVPNVEVQTQEFKDYYYAGEAELNHYDLQQICYGDVRQGHEF